MRKKVFISHSRKDGKYADVFLELLRNFGFHDEEIFCSSNYSTSAAYGELIFERMKTELKDGPVMIYLLSNNYYGSVVCLNEMGASWMMSESHYPIALPKFKTNEITGAITSERLTLSIDSQFETNDLFRLIELVSSSANVPWPEKVKLNPTNFIDPLTKKMNNILLESNSLLPKDGFFETILGERRELKGNLKDKACCYKLPNNILAKYLDVNDDKTEKSQFLFIWKTQGDFKTGDKVRFGLKDSEQKHFSDIGLCRNIYVTSIEKI